MPLVAPLVALGTFALVMWLIAIALAIAVVMGYISGVLHGLPFPLNQLAGPVNSLAKGISNVAGKLEDGIDKLIGASWHAMARLLDLLWGQLEARAHLLVVMADLLWRLIHGQRVLRHLVHSLIGGAHSVGSAVKTLEREFHGIEHRVKRIEHEIAQGIGDDVRTGLRALRKELRGFERAADNAIANVDTAAQGAISDLKRFLGIRNGLGYLAWAAGIVAAVIGIEAVNLFRCPTWLNKTSKRGCGLWNDLEGLLALFADTFLLANICELLPILETAVSDIADPLVVALTDVGAGLCSGGIGAAPALSIPALSLPASPGVTLHLP